MTVLGTKMARSVAIYILGIDVSTMLDQCLYDAKITSQTSNMQWRTEVIRSCINLRSEFDQNLNQRRMSFARRQMERSEAIRIGAVHDFEHLVVLIEVLLCECQDFYDFSSVALVHFCPVVHLDFLDVLFSVFLLL